MDMARHLLAILLFIPALCMAQDTSQNFVRTVTMLDADGTDSIQAVRYYNGLGWPTVSVATVDANGGTACTLTAYDALGRACRKYVPVPGSGLDHMAESAVISAGYGFHHDNSCFTESRYDALDNFTFYYYNRDHLGSIRQVVKLDGSSQGSIVQSMDYYPSGTQFCDGTTDGNVQSHKYNGKEFDRMHGLNTYDYGARQYNPVTARWDRMDPLCEKYYAISPYAYCANNPVRYIDPDGKEWTYVKDPKGNIIINVALNFSISGNWTVGQISEYKNAISCQFNNMLFEASGGTVFGTIIFYDGNSSIIQSLSLGAYDDNTFGGLTEYFASSVNLSW